MMKKSLMLTIAACLSLTVSGQVFAQGDGLKRAVDATANAQRANVRSQQNVSRLDDETRRSLERYRAALWQSQQLNVYAEQLEPLLDQQANEISSLKRQMDDLEVTSKELLPLILRMMDGLEKFVAMDAPFLQVERKERVEQVRASLADGETTLAEKYRRVLEAYQIETQYGKTLGAERSNLKNTGGDDRIVDLLRIGRTALFYLTLEGGEGGRWDKNAQKWQPLQDKHIAAVRRGLRVARETATAELLILPMNGAEVQK